MNRVVVFGLAIFFAVGVALPDGGNEAIAGGCRARGRLFSNCRLFSQRSRSTRSRTSPRGDGVPRAPESEVPQAPTEAQAMIKQAPPLAVYRVQFWR